VDQARGSSDQSGWQTLHDHMLDSPGRNAGGEPEAQPWSSAPVEAVADDDLDLIAEVNRKPSRMTVLLVAGIFAALAFTAGSVVQKQFGGTTSAAAAPGAAGFAGRGGGTAGAYGGFGQGGFPGGGPGGAAGGAAGGTAGGAAGGAAGRTTGAAATPVVVGTVTKLSGTSLTVKNLGGKSVPVTVKEGATITLVAGKTLTTLKTGATVSVVGTAAADGKVTATSITVRS
jgi:hypothetical protein